MTRRCAHCNLIEGVTASTVCSPCVRRLMRQLAAWRASARRWRRCAVAMILIAVIAVGAATVAESRGDAGHAQTARKAPVYQWRATTATWYGPGLYGNGTACGQRYTTRIRGVAIGHDALGRWLANCGDVFVIRYKGRTVRVRVIDRCPGCRVTAYSNHRFDLSARTAQDLCRCWRPYTMRVRWRQVPR